MIALCVIVARASAAGVWTDSTYRRILTLLVDADNAVVLAKTTTDNQLAWVYEANTIVEQEVSTAMGGSVAWFSAGITWSKAAEAVVYYLNGASVGTPDAALGVWAGVLDLERTAIGTSRTTGTDLWSGYLGQVAIWASPLTPSEMAFVGAI